MQITEPVMTALEWLLRHASARAVGKLDAPRLLKLMRLGPRDELEEAILVNVLNGDLARARLLALVEAGAVPAERIQKVVRGLVAKGHFRKNGPAGHEPRDWVEWADRARAGDLAAGVVDHAGPIRRGRKPLDPAGPALTTAQRTKRYDDARRTDGLVRKTIWLTREASDALSELVEQAGAGATNGSVAGAAILAFHADRSRRP